MFTRRRFIESSAAVAGGLLFSQAEAQTSSGTRLDVEFIGLCAFVKDPIARGMRVGLINAKYFDHMHPVLPEHFGWLAVETTGLKNPQVGEPVEKEELWRWRLGTSGTFRKWRLNLRHVAMTVSRPDPLDDDCSKAAHLTAALRQADPDHKEPALKTNWWALNNEAERVVTGTVVLANGDIKNGNARKDNYKHRFDEADWTFQPFLHEPPVDQKMLDAFKCTTKNVTSIELTGHSPETIQLNDNAKARAFVVNMPRCPQESPTHPPRILYHVRAYYALFEGFKTDTPLDKLRETPIPIATNLKSKMSAAALPIPECIRIEGDIYCPGGGP